MSLSTITDVAGLHAHLRAAMQLEHATIPPYLTALYSIEPGTNAPAYQIIRAVAVEEMLHLTLAANVLNAVGGTPDLTVKGFVPRYPARLPDGEEDFEVDCAPFSKATVETFLKIERPAQPQEGKPRTVKRKHKPGMLLAAKPHDGMEEHFYSIGEFYRAIEEGIERLHKEMGDALFCGDPARQIGPEYYYSGGGDIVKVTDLASAKAALDLIAEQGEGVTGHVFEEGSEIPHFYRFEQLVLGRYYREGDRHGSPSGGVVDVDWDAVLPIRTNCRMDDLAPGSAARRGAEAFDREYAAFLDLLTKALQGSPELFIPAVGGMFKLKELFHQLMRQPIPGTDETAAPAFDIDAVTMEPA